MKIEKKKIRLGLWLIFCLTVLGCKSVLYETYDIQEDRSRMKLAQANLEDSIKGDNAGAGASISAYGRTYKVDGKEIDSGKYDQVIAHNPYRISISVGAPKHPIRGLMSEIEVQEVYFEMSYQNGEKKKVSMSSVRKDWVKNTYKKTKFVDESISFGTSLKKQNIGNNGQIDIDYSNLKEIRFYIKYTGIYENGDSREYWQERYFVPVHTEDRRNGLENMARQ